MKEKGLAHMGIGRGTGENRAVEAAKQAIQSPLLETTIDGATGILLNITGGDSLGLFEVNEAAELVAQAAHPDANIIFGAVIDENLDDEISITVIATGFDQKKVDSVTEMRRSPNRVGDTSLTPDFQEDDLVIPTFLRRGRN